MTGGGWSPRLGWAPAPRAGEGAAGPRPSSWRRRERTSEPRAGTRSRAGGLGDSERRGRGPRGDAPDGWGAGGGRWHLRAKHTKGRAARRLVASWGGAEPSAGAKIRDPWGRGFSLGPHLRPGFGSRLSAKGCGGQTEARGGKRHSDEGWRCRLCARIIAGLVGAGVASVVPRRWDAGSFRCSAALTPCLPAVCTLALGVPVSGSTCSLARGTS